MSKIKQLRKLDSNNINLIDIFEQLLILPETKYVEMIQKLSKNKFGGSEMKKDMFQELYERVPGVAFDDDMEIFHLLFLQNLITWIDPENINMMNTFISHNERKLVEKNDLTTYNSFEEVSCEISKVDLKTITKEMESQVISLYSDDDWIVIKPLTYESSKKYGSNTKWCTTSNQNPEYFFRYTKNGILIYCMNRKTGYKVAAYKDLKERDVSFWNQRDERIDSFYTELTDEILSVLRKEFKVCSKPNGQLIDPSLREKEMMKYFKEKEKSSLNELVEAPRRIRVDNRYDEQPLTAEDDMGGDERIEIGERYMDDEPSPIGSEPMGEIQAEERYPNDNRAIQPRLTSDQIFELLSDSSDRAREHYERNEEGREVDMVARAKFNYEEDMPQRG